MALEHTAATVLARYLISNGIVKLPPAIPWPAYVNFMAETPNEAIAVVDTLGEMKGREMRGGKVLEKPGINIQIRAMTNPIGTNFGLKLCNVLEALNQATVVVPAGGGIVTKTYLVSLFQRTSPVYPLGQEEGGSRFLYSLNGLLTYSEVLP